MGAVPISGVAAAAVIGSVLVISYAPSSAIAVLSAHTAGVDPMTYLIQYQLPVAIPAILVTAVVHVIVQNYLDKRDKATGSLLSIDPKVVEEKTRRAANLPGYYALLPLVPLVLLFIFNKMVYKTVVLDVAIAMFIGWVFGILVDLLHRRNLQACFQDGFAMFKGMGHMMQSVVGLIFVAALFADGLKNAGLVGLMIVTVLTGSGVASFTGLVPIAPTVAAGFGGDPTVLAMMLQLASEFLRPVSPVAGVIIIVAGFAGVSPLAVVRRTWIPCFAGLIVALAATVILF